MAVVLSMLICCLSGEARGQEAVGDLPIREIVVTVKDLQADALSNATVFIVGSDQVTSTDESGLARIRTRETHPLVGIRRLGYAEQQIRVSVGDAPTYQLLVMLNPVVTLGKISVVADAPRLTPEIERRRLAGYGTIFGVEDFAKVHSIKDLLNRVHGANVIGAGRKAVAFPDRKGGSCWADLYIDGHLSLPYIRNNASPIEIGMAKLDDIDSISPDEAAAMEVYPRAGAAPQDVVRLGKGCGAIFVWTKGWMRAHMPVEASKKAP